MSRTSVSFLFLITLIGKLNSQGLIDYYVTLNNDTVKNVTLEIGERLVKVWGSDYRKLRPEQIKSIYSVGQFYYPILLKPKGKLKILRCEKPGDINLFRRVKSQSGHMWQDANGFTHYTEGGTIESFYILTANSRTNLAVRIKRIKDIVYLAPDRRLMDSIYNRELGPEITSLVEKYNKIAERKKQKNE